MVGSGKHNEHMLPFNDSFIVVVVVVIIIVIITSSSPQPLYLINKCLMYCSLNCMLVEACMRTSSHFSSKKKCSWFINSYSFFYLPFLGIGAFFLLKLPAWS